MQSVYMQPELLFFHDDGQTPNSHYPVLIYRNAFAARHNEGAVLLEKRFAGNGWSNFCRSGISVYDHYHSAAHEVVGIYDGETELQLGGERGNRVAVSAGDIIILPAGTSYKNLRGENDVRVVGAYDQSGEYDLLNGTVNDNPDSIKNIHSVPFPEADPVTGAGYGLCTIWKVMA